MFICSVSVSSSEFFVLGGGYFFFQYFFPPPSHSAACEMMETRGKGPESFFPAALKFEILSRPSTSYSFCLVTVM